MDSYEKGGNAVICNCCGKQREVVATGISRLSDNRTKKWNNTNTKVQQAGPTTDRVTNISVDKKGKHNQEYYRT